MLHCVDAGGTTTRCALTAARRRLAHVDEALPAPAFSRYVRQAKRGRLVLDRGKIECEADRDGSQWYVTMIPRSFAAVATASLRSCMRVKLARLPAILG